MLFSKQTPAAGGDAFAQFDAAWCYDGNGYILNDTGTSLDVRIGASGSVQTLASGATLPIKLVFSMAELYVRRTDQSTTQVTVEAQVGTGSAGGGGSTADMAVIAAASTAAHDKNPAAHLVPFRQTIRWENVQNDQITGSGATAGSTGMQVGLKTGTGGGSISRRMAADFGPILRGGSADGATGPFMSISTVAVREAGVLDGVLLFSYGLSASETKSAGSWFGWYADNGRIGLCWHDGSAETSRPTVFSVVVGVGVVITVEKTTSQIRMLINGSVVDSAPVVNFSTRSYTGPGIFVSSAISNEEWRFSAVEVAS